MPCIKIDKSHIVRQNKITASDMCLLSSDIYHMLSELLSIKQQHDVILIIGSEIMPCIKMDKPLG